MTPKEATAGPTIRLRRQALGLTQVELAQAAGVSLPTLQTLEAGRSNPSIETLRSLARELGLQVQLSPRSCQWERLVELGLPLASLGPSKAHVWSTDELVRETRLALLEEPPTPRHRDALVGLLLAISEHFPSLFRRKFGRNPRAAALTRTVRGKHIPLKRLALAKLAEQL
jgi:transcriptional regulator with XRE-family HTH domain